MEKGLFDYHTKDMSETTVDLGYCENDCSHNHGCSNFCRDEFQLTTSSKAKSLCKYYSDSVNI